MQNNTEITEPVTSDKINVNSSEKFLQNIGTFADSFRIDLITAENKFEQTKKTSENNYQEKLREAELVFANEKEQFEKERESNINKTYEMLKKLREVIESCVESVDRIRQTGTNTAYRIAEYSMDGIHTAKQDVELKIKNKRTAYENLCRAQIENAENNRQIKIEQASETRDVGIKSANIEMQNKRKSLRDSRSEKVAQSFNKSIISKYNSYNRFSVVDYDCVTEIPEYVLLGKIELVIPNSTENEKFVNEVLNKELSVISEEHSSEYIVSIPYIHKISDGISLLMRHSSGNRDNTLALLSPILLNIFLSFPPGKIEATMIDPLGSGKNFSEIPKLAQGPNSQRIIDTKVWSKENEIEDALSRLRSYVATITQSYGKDYKSRLEKEELKILAIADFPQGFTDNALKDFHNVIINAASVGIFIIVTGDDGSINALKQHHDSLYSALSYYTIETVSLGNRLKLSGNSKNKLYLHIDTLDDLLLNKDIKDEIINQYSENAEHAKRRVESFDSLYDLNIHDGNEWFLGNDDEISLPLGVEGADTIVKMVLGRGGGSTEHHALIAGLTGAGKSTLFHTMIMSALVNYRPEDVQMYLLDFKEGVEFHCYTKYRLPSFRVIALHSEREFALSILKELCDELDNRTRLFAKYGVAEINEYRKLTTPNKPRMPKLMLIFDEVQELFISGEDNDNISAQCLRYIKKLVLLGRAPGIHLIFATQDYNNCSGLQSVFSSMMIRIVIKGAGAGAASILAADNDITNLLKNKPAGSAVYNHGGGSTAYNRVFQISRLPENERDTLLQELNDYYCDKTVALTYTEEQTRVLVTKAEDDINNGFNRLVYLGRDNATKFSKSQEGYGLLIGQGLDRRGLLIPELTTENHDNLLIVGENEKTAMSFFILTSLSILYESLFCEKDLDKTIIYIANLSDDSGIDSVSCDYDTLKSYFAKHISITQTQEQVKVLVSELYSIVQNRIKNGWDKSERLFFMVFGIDRAMKLKPGGLYSNAQDSDLSDNEKLCHIVSEGSRVGVNAIVWGEEIKCISSMLGNGYNGFFNKRIAYDLSDSDLNELVGDRKPLPHNTAAYRDIEIDNKAVHFRPYETPTRHWTESFSEAFYKTLKFFDTSERGESNGK